MANHVNYGVRFEQMNDFNYRKMERTDFTTCGTGIRILDGRLVGVRRTF